MSSPTEKLDDASRIKEVLNKFRERDVAVIGIGITKAGKAIRNTYAPRRAYLRRGEQSRLNRRSPLEKIP